MKIPERATPFLGELIIADHLFPEGPASRGTGRESGVVHTAGLSWGRDQQSMCWSCGPSTMDWKRERSLKRKALDIHD